MAKKTALALFAAVLTAGGALAQIPLSAGLGGTFSAYFFDVSWNSNGKKVLDTFNMDSDLFNKHFIGGGFFAFFDATYGMASLGMNFYSVIYVNEEIHESMQDDNETESLTELTIGLYGKYPFDLGKVTLFPLLGIDIKLVLANTTSIDGEEFKYTNIDGEEFKYMNEDGEGANPFVDLSSLWFKAGVGVDIPLNEKLYLRPMFLYGLGLNNRAQSIKLRDMNNPVTMASFINHGLDLKIALGYRF